MLHELHFAPGPGQHRGKYSTEYKPYFKMFKSFVNHGAIEKIEENQYRNPPLYYTVYEGHIDIAKIMIEHEASVNAKIDKNKTLAEIIVENDKFELFKLLMNNCMEMPTGIKVVELLKRSICNGNEELIKFLITPDNVKALN